MPMQDVICIINLALFVGSIGLVILSSFKKRGIFWGITFLYEIACIIGNFHVKAYYNGMDPYGSPEIFACWFGMIAFVPMVLVTFITLIFVWAYSPKSKSNSTKAKQFRFNSESE